QQTAEVMTYLGRVLEELGADLVDLVRLRCFYVNDGTGDEDEFLEMVAAGLPAGAHPAVTAIPFPYLAYEGMCVEIEAIAMRGRDNARMTRQYAPLDGLSPLPEPFAQGVRCGRMIYMSGQSPRDVNGVIIDPGDIVTQTNTVMAQHGRALNAFGAGFDDVVKINRWYGGQGGIEDFEPAALACAAHFKEPGPAATGIPIPRHAWEGMGVKIETVAMLGEDGSYLKREHVWPEGHWDWHVHLPYKHGLKCGEMIFLGGQVSINQKGCAIDPGQLTQQTKSSMENIRNILSEFGADFDDVVKVLTLYDGDCGEDALNANLPIRSSYFTDPGPTSTGVPLPELAYPGMMVEIDIDAMKE
ncbi:MAG: RidA family protein, partial [Rhodospirillales bacterium]|nr:RidA family protein [Rhodospirillales bacterium]